MGEQGLPDTAALEIRVHVNLVDELPPTGQ